MTNQRQAINHGHGPEVDTVTEGHLGRKRSRLAPSEGAPKRPIALTGVVKTLSNSEMVSTRVCNEARRASGKGTRHVLVQELKWTHLWWGHRLVFCLVD